jgi:hypothetical protein
MTPRELRQQIDATDRRLKELRGWENQLVSMRRRYLVDDSDTARWALAIIDEGLGPGAGRPNDPELAPLDGGKPGLRATRETIAGLAERRALLEHQRPSSVDTAKTAEAARVSADAIVERTTQFDAQTRRLRIALDDLARLALAVATETRQLWEENVGLDALCADGDIARPETPRHDAAAIPAANPTGALLMHHFLGGSPDYVDQDLVRDIRASLRARGGAE